MKLLAALFVLLIAFPFALTGAIASFRNEGTGYPETELADLAQPGGGSDYRVAVEGYLLRPTSPDAAKVEGEYVLPLVSQAVAGAAVTSGAFAFAPDATPVFVQLPGEQVPVEMFWRAQGGGAGPVAVPFRFNGTQRSVTEKVPSAARAVPGVTAGQEIVLLKVDGSGPPTRGTTIGFGVAALAVLFIGLKLLGSWRRGRRERREAAARFAAQRASSPFAQTGADASGKATQGGGGFDFPWGKVAGVIAMLGVIGARVGKSAGSSIDNVARTALKSADEVAPLGRSADSMTSGERAAEALGTALDIESAAELGYNLGSLGAEDSSSQRPLPKRKGAREVNLTLMTTDADETYFADALSEAEISDWSTDETLGLDVTPPPGEPLRFSLHRTKTDASLNGRISGAPKIAKTVTSTSLPDRSHGEFTQLELAPAGDGVRMTHVFGFAFEEGYVEVFRATADLEYLNGGSWSELCVGDRPITLGFTEAGRAEYARTIAPSYARAVEFSLGKEGLKDVQLTAEFFAPPEEFIEVTRGRLLLSQRNESALVLRGSGG